MQIVRTLQLALSRNHCCHENETIHSHFIVVGVDVTVKNKKNNLLLPWKCNTGFPFHCCPATMYFVLLLKIIGIRYSECVSVFLPQFSSMQSACAVLYCHLWPVWLCHILPHYLINGTIFGKKKVAEHKMCFDFPYNFF